MPKVQVPKAGAKAGVAKTTSTIPTPPAEFIKPHDVPTKSIPEVGLPKQTKKASVESLICRGGKKDCDELGTRCPGSVRASCSGWVCKKHTLIGSQRPFTGLKVCRVCHSRQRGTKDYEGESK